MTRRSRTPDGHDLQDVAREPQVLAILLANAMRGMRVQSALRLVLAVFVLATVAVVPPAEQAATCVVIAVAYLVWAASLALLLRQTAQRAVQYVWLALAVDLLVLTALSLLASLSDEQSWTTDVLVNAFFLVPVIAATQLRPWVTTAVVLPTVAVFFASSAAARGPNAEPWSSVILHTLALAGVGVACILLSRVQQARVVDIGALASDRIHLLDQTQRIEERERRDLAEHLHDGALQYVLAARQDLEDVGADPQADERVDHALREAAQLLRSTMTELHPAVLASAGLARAMEELTRGIAARGGLRHQVTVAGWPDDLRTPADDLLYATARELLTNVVKHAGASGIEVGLERAGGRARLTVADDGRGIAPEVMQRRLSEGHIGLASRRIRLEAAGGSLRVAPRSPAGTVAVAELPVAR